MKWAVHGACKWEKKGVYRVLLRKPEESKPLARSRIRWEYNIKMDLQEIECGMDWTDVAQYRNNSPALGNTVMILRFPLM